MRRRIVQSGLTGICFVAAGIFAHAAPPESAPAELRHAAYENALRAAATAGGLRAWHDQLASQPHLAGSPGDARNIQFMANAFREMGLDVQVHEFWAYLSKPMDAALQIISPDPITLSVKEQPLKEDPFSADANLTIGFNAYSGSGDVTAEIVYANYGTKSDFEKLKELGVDCTGKIVLARYGGNFRGYKAKFAQEAGAAGLLIYTDPDDGGYRKGVPYPEGGWANETCIQRGSLITLDYPGDPLTPGTAATEHADRLDPETIDLPHIPVQPIGYGAAREIMLRMKGRALPENLIATWQGGLPCAYRLEGGGDLRVRLMVNQKREITKSANVIATLKGSQHPEQSVIVGCHHDAWCHGAGDPLAGTILLFEAAKSFSQAMKQGFTPARTIVFAAWGAEEYGMIGSTEYCEQFAEELSRSGVAYINLDAAAMGPVFSASASPSLKRLIEEVTRDVPQARSAENKTVQQVWLGDRKEVSFGDLGGGSDHVGFYCHLGIPSCGLNGGGSAGTAYHSNYDDLLWYRKVVGEDYEPALMLTRIVNLLTVRLADAQLLPLDPVRYAADAKVQLQALMKRAETLKREVNFSSLFNQIDNYAAQSQSAHDEMIKAFEAGRLSRPTLVAINNILLLMERDWLREVQSESKSSSEKSKVGAVRSWYRNQFMASDPDSGYASWGLPDLRWAIEHEKIEAVDAAENAVRSVFARLAVKMGAIQTIVRAADEVTGDPQP